MSRAYRVAVSETITEVIHVEDGIQSRLELLDILPKEELADLLAAELEKTGFERDGDTMRRTDDDGVDVIVDLTEGTVTVRIGGDTEVNQTVEQERWVGNPEQAGNVENNLRKNAKESLKRHVEQKRAELGEELAKKLEGKLKDLKQELDQATNRVTAEALKIKAGRIGEIQEVQEDAETGAITIKVKV